MILKKLVELVQISLKRSRRLLQFNNLNGNFHLICLGIVFVSSIFVYLESKKIDRTNSYLIIPSILFNMFNLIGLMIVMILN